LQILATSPVVRTFLPFAISRFPSVKLFISLIVLKPHPV
jgi:hypothetical protein